MTRDVVVLVFCILGFHEWGNQLSTRKRIANIKAETFASLIKQRVDVSGGCGTISIPLSPPPLNTFWFFFQFFARYLDVVNRSSIIICPTLDPFLPSVTDYIQTNRKLSKSKTLDKYSYRNEIFFRIIL